MKSFLSRHKFALALALVALLSLNGFRQAQRTAADFDALFEPPAGTTRQIALVSIHPDDYQQLFNGTSPLDAQQFGRLVARILEGKPAVLGVDIDTSHPGFAGLRARFADTGRTAMVWAQNATPARPGDEVLVAQGVLGGPASTAPGTAGAALLIADGEDGVVRRYARLVRIASGTVRSFPWAVVDAQDAAKKLHLRESDAPLQIRFARAERLDLPAAVVLAPGFEWSSRIENRIVLLGGRYDRADIQNTPLGTMDGIDVLANAVETELGGGGYEQPALALVLTVALVELIALLLLFDHVSFWKALAIAVGGTMVFAWLLAALGWLPAWSQAALILLVVLLNQLGLEIFRKQRLAIKASAETLKDRLSGKKSP